MAKRARISESDDSDRLEGYPHPRETQSLVGHDVALGRAARAIRSGKPPQGWLISGPPGIGKATMAYRIARYLLAYGAHDTGAADLSVPANDPNAIQVKAGSHPGLLVLKRGINERTGKPMTELPVSEVRRLAGFFGLTSGAGGWRVAIVDTADDMNDSAANAILKLLEEPPSRAIALPAAGSSAAGRKNRYRCAEGASARRGCGGTQIPGAAFGRFDRRCLGAGGRRGARIGGRGRQADRERVGARCYRASGFGRQALAHP